MARAAHQRRRVHFFQPLDGGFRDFVAVGGAGFDDVQQQHMRAGIGGMGGDARPHDARADDGDGTDFPTDFRHVKWPPDTVAMPWPPPMHCVASA